MPTEVGEHDRNTAHTSTARWRGAIAGVRAGALGSTAARTAPSYSVACAAASLDQPAHSTIEGDDSAAVSRATTRREGSREDTHGSTSQSGQPGISHQSPEMAHLRRVPAPCVQTVPYPAQRESAVGDAPLAATSGDRAEFPRMDTMGDLDHRDNAYDRVAGNAGEEGDFIVDRWLAKVPTSVWHPNAVVPQHRRKANLYWALLLTGYVIYIGLAIRDALNRRKSPPVQLTRVEEPFQLPDVGFCFEGDTYGSRFACFDDTDGQDCADSYTADVFVYGYNKTGYTTPDEYDSSDEYIVLLPEVLSDTCQKFKLSDLTATDSGPWNFHMLMFWNSSYDSAENPGAFESIRMYLYEADLAADEVLETPVTLYAPISFNASVVPFVRGFLEYEQQVSLDDHVEHSYTVVDTTASSWHNAEDAVDLAAAYGTDSLASIQLDIRRQSYYQYAEVDPLDIVGTLGEISGFWLVVPLMFGLLFYRPVTGDEDAAEMRSFTVCGGHKTQNVEDARSDFSGRVHARHDSA